MLITDYSEQNFNEAPKSNNIPLSEILTAGAIFILPILFLLIISAS